MKHFLLLFAWITSSTLFANIPIDSGYHITVSIEDYQNDTLLLGQHYGNQQYLKDTAYRNDEGLFVFEDDEDLPGGVYLMVLKPDNNFFQLLVNPV